MKFFVVLSFMFFSLTSFAGDQTCFDNLLDKKVLLAFDDGDIHQITFKKNRLSIITANYANDDTGEPYYKNIVASCMWQVHGESFIDLYKDRKSPIGTYRYAVRIRLPIEIINGQSTAEADLRWGYNKYPTIFVKDLP